MALKARIILALNTSVYFINQILQITTALGSFATCGDLDLYVSLHPRCLPKPFAQNEPQHGKHDIDFGCSGLMVWEYTEPFVFLRPIQFVCYHN